MKKIILTLFVCSFFLAACEKDKRTVYCCGYTYSKSMSVINFKKGDLNDWKNHIFTDTVKNGVYNLWTKKNNLALNLRIRYDKLATNGANGYPSKDHQVNFYQINYLTFGTLVYKLDTTANNSLTIERIVGPDDNGVSREWLSGWFNFTLKLSTPTGNTTFDTTRVYFPTGHFTLRLDK